LHKQGGSTDGAESETANFFNSQTSMEDDSTNSDGCSDESDCCVQANTEVVTSRRKDIWADTSAAINKKSLSFLLKKMFICGGGFSPTPSLKNQVPESRMEKVDANNAYYFFFWLLIKRRKKGISNTVSSF